MPKPTNRHARITTPVTTASTALLLFVRGGSGGCVGGGGEVAMARLQSYSTGWLEKKFPVCHARIAATPAAPAPMHAAALPLVTPPTANTGTAHSAAWRRAASPSAGPNTNLE